MNAKQFLMATLGSALLLVPVLAQARQGGDQPQENVVDAARKAQAEKKSAPKAKLTIDNDNLSSITGTVSVVGPQPAAAPDSSKAPADKAAAPGDAKGSGKGESYWRNAFAEANKKLADDSHELDVMQRESNLKQQQYYSDPNTALKQDYSRQDLTDLKTQIDEKTAAVAADKQAISDLEDELRKAGGDPGWENAPPQGQTSAPAASGAAPASGTPATSTAPAQQ